MLTGIGIGVPFTRRRGFSAGDLFANGEAGAWYDPSDFSTMFQDSAGTTAAAIGQPVGLMMDNSKGLVLGSELVTNGTFDGDSATGWTLVAGATVSGGKLNIANIVANVNATYTVETGKFYQVTFDVSNYVSGTGFITVGGKPTSFLSGGSKSTIIGPTTSTIIRINESGGNQVFSLDNISVKELPGNHATQATSTARPVLRAGLDYDGVDDKHSQSAGGGSTTQFFLCAGIKPEGGAGAVRVLWSDAGTGTGYIVRINAANQLELAAGNGTAYTTIATVATLSVGTAYVVTVWDDGTNLNVQVNNGAVASVARPVVAAGTATASIGSDNGAATGWFNGLIYSLIQVKDDAGTDAERASAKAYVASKAGVTL